MTALPSAEQFTGANVTEGQFKSALATLRGYLAGLLGDSGEIADALAALAVPLSSVATKTAAYTIGLGDRGRVLSCSGSWTLGLPSVATAMTGFAAVIQNGGSGTITIDPAGAELIDGAATLGLLPGTTALLVCTGSTWIAIGCQPATARLLAQAGTAALPGLAFALDTNTGLLNPAADQIGFATGGVQRALLSGSALQLDVVMTGTAVTQTSTDTTAGRLLRVGDFGLGAATPPTCADLNDSTLRNGFYRTVGGVLNWSGLPQEWGSLQVIRTPNRITQIWYNDNTASFGGQVFRRMWDSVSTTWTPWYRMLDSRSSVGAITRHTDGQPTGPILERGSNANGDYTRLADGTQICAARLAGAAANAAIGSIFRSGDITWTYPATFAAEPRVHADCAGASNLWANARPATTGNTTSAIARLFSYQSDATAWDVTFTAIGRWF